MALNRELCDKIIQALGHGSGHPYCGDDEGQVDFWTAAGSHYASTVLQAGADGTTTYAHLVSTWTAPESTVVTDVFLYGTTLARTSRSTPYFATQTVSKTLQKGDSYMIYWTLHAEI